MSTDPNFLVKTCAAALLKMRDARLADYGTFPKTDEGVAGMARTYAEALGPDPDRPGDPDIDAECVLAAVRRLIRDADASMPSAGKFRELCGEEWHRLYKLVGREVVSAEGVQYTTLDKVRRDASRDEVRRAIGASVNQAGSRGLSLPTPAPEIAPEMRARIEAIRSGDPSIVKGMP